MQHIQYILSIIFVLSNPLASAHAAGGSGLPVPRFVSLKSSETNIRTGPGTRYPILWVYKRKHFPIEVTEEYDLWRKIRDVEGAVGWVHKSMLDGNRYVIISGDTPAVMKSEPKHSAANIIKAAPMVIGRLVECELEWCNIQIAGRKGWITKNAIWGVYLKEVID